MWRHSFMKTSPNLERAAGMLLSPIIVVGFAVAIYIVLKPAPKLPISQADGAYANTCCGTLVLKAGRGAYGKATFDYVIERDKVGPYVMPTSRLVVDDDASRLVIVQHGAPLKLRLEISAKPQWIDIPDLGRKYRFMRKELR